MKTSSHKLKDAYRHMYLDTQEAIFSRDLDVMLRYCFLLYIHWVFVHTQWSDAGSEYPFRLTENDLRLLPSQRPKRNRGKVPEPLCIQFQPHWGRSGSRKLYRIWRNTHLLPTSWNTIASLPTSAFSCFESLEARNRPFQQCVSAGGDGNKGFKGCLC